MLYLLIISALLLFLLFFPGLISWSDGGTRPNSVWGLSYTSYFMWKATKRPGNWFINLGASREPVTLVEGVENLEDFLNQEEDAIKGSGKEVIMTGYHVTWLGLEWTHMSFKENKNA